MSGRQQPTVRVDLNTLVQQLRALEEYIAALQSTIDGLNTTLNVLYAGEKALEQLRDGSVDALVDLDGGGVVYGKARIEGGGNARVLVHAGLDVFVELPIDRALKVIRERQADVSRVLDRYRRELMEAVSTYQQLRGLLEQVLRSRQASQ